MVRVERPNSLNRFEGSFARRGARDSITLLPGRASAAPQIALPFASLNYKPLFFYGRSFMDCQRFARPPRCYPFFAR